jgi:hypothetical protein
LFATLISSRHVRCCCERAHRLPLMFSRPQWRSPHCRCLYISTVRRSTSFRGKEKGGSKSRGKTVQTKTLIFTLLPAKVLPANVVATPEIGSKSVLLQRALPHIVPERSFRLVDFGALR